VFFKEQEGQKTFNQIGISKPFLKISEQTTQIWERYSQDQKVESDLRLSLTNLRYLRADSLWIISLFLTQT
jgi:hypothetical protein